MKLNSPGPKTRSLLHVFATLLSGALMALSMPPTAWWPLLFPCLSVFYVLLAPQKNWRAFATGWLFGFGYFIVGLYWIGNALLVPGNEFKWVWPLAILGLPIGLALFTGIAAYAATRWAELKTWPGYCAFAFCLVSSEYLRGHIFTGFPWNLYGYAWANLLPMVQSVSLFGVYGLTLLSVLWGSVPGLLYLRRASVHRTSVTALLIIASITGLYMWGSARLSSHPTDARDDIIIRVVQPNIPQEDKAKIERLVPNLQKLVGASAGDFIPGMTYAIIWPETAISDFIIEDENVSDYIRTTLMQNDPKRFLVAGTLRHEQQNGKTIYFNGLVTYDAALKSLDSYDKSHLVPFGEYIPFKNLIPLHPFVNFSGFTTGNGIETQTTTPLPPFSGLICYEVIFPGAVAKKMPRPEWMINVTNDGWYGDSAGPYQHLAMAVYRAVEEGVPLIRSANTGISAVIDANGRITNQLTYGTAGFIDAPLPRALHSTTPYGKFGDFGVIFGLLLLAALTLAGRKPH